MGHEKGCSKQQARFADSCADDDAQAGLLGGVGSRAQVGKSGPDGADRVRLLEESAG
jgi:hypothetical protein